METLESPLLWYTRRPGFVIGAVAAIAGLVAWLSGWHYGHSLTTLALVVMMVGFDRLEVQPKLRSTTSRRSSSASTGRLRRCWSSREPRRCGNRTTRTTADGMLVVSAAILDQEAIPRHSIRTRVVPCSSAHKWRLLLQP